MPFILCGTPHLQLSTKLHGALMGANSLLGMMTILLDFGT